MAVQGYEMERPIEPKTAYRSEELVGDPRQVAPQVQYSQQLQEKFGLTSMIGFSCTIMITWEAILFVWYTCVALCLSELNSIYPTAGGQYHWTCELAPKSWRKPLSYMTDGCLCWVGKQILQARHTSVAQSFKG
ncbi:hypothetical protein KC351_g4091 [Hortaea werneckii]|nr:hypothetical protein KC351_g4091 [Hortaea werneckii]